MKPRRPISPISSARRASNAVYRVLVAGWRMHPKNWKCAKCGRPADKHPHHIIPRSVRPDLVCCVENFLALCFPCHRWIDSNRALAYAAGLLGKSWETLAEIAARRSALDK